MLIYQLSKSTDNIEKHWGAAKHKAEVDKRQEERHYTGDAGETLPTVHRHMALPGFATRWGHRLLHIHSPFQDGPVPYIDIFA